MTRLLVRGQLPGIDPARDTKLLADLASYRDEADTIAARIKEADRKLRILDRTLDAPEADKHPNYNEARTVASRLFWHIKRLYTQMSHLADQVAEVVAKLSPDAEERCRKLWNYHVCTGPHSQQGVWIAIGIHPPQLRRGYGKGKDWG